MKGTTRQEQKQQTRELLLQTAYRCFCAGGILGTRMSDIARAAGVSHGTVFLHFQTQEELVAEVVERSCGRIAARTHELAEGCGSVEELLRAHLAGIREFEAFYTRLVVENRLLPQPVRDAWIAAQSAVAFHLEPSLEKAAAEAGIAVPASMLFNLWLGLVHYGLANGDLFAPEGGVVERCGDSWVDAYLRLLRQR